jgi:heme O synthase-like polyprenyltransferase
MTDGKKAKILFEIVFGLAGFSLFWYATNWMAALGFFLALFGNNIAHTNRWRIPDGDDK